MQCIKALDCKCDQGITFMVNLSSKPKGAFTQKTLPKLPTFPYRTVS